MIHPVFLYCTIYFILGALGFYKANKNATPELRKERWTKLIVFAVIVYSVFSLILFRAEWLRYLTFPIIGIAIFEVSSIAFKHKRKYGVMALAILYLLFSGGWMWSFKTSASSEFMTYAFFLVFVFDGFAQVTGLLFGKKKIFPKTSPNKSREGFIGGLLMCIISAILFRNWVGFEMMQAFKYGLIIGLCAISGDWLASKYKRTFGIKDFSKLIPGHGGVLDRFDSWILTSAILGMLLFV